MFKERQGSCGPVRELSEVWMMLGRVETRSDLAAEGYDVELGCGGWRESLGTVGDSCWGDGPVRQSLRVHQAGPLQAC